MRVLMTAHPGWGHLHSMIPVARALEEAGHEVRLATAATLVPRLRELGVNALGAGVDWEVSEADRLAPGFLRGSALSQTRVLARLSGQGIVEDLLALAEEWRPDVVVRDAYELGGLIAGRRLGVPVAVHGITVRLPPELAHRGVGRQLGKLQERYGVTIDPDADLWLSFLPPSFTPPEWPQLADEHHVRPLLFDRSGHEELPDWVDDLDGPLVYVTLGTVFNRYGGLFAKALDALADEPVSVVATVGRNVDPASLGAVPPNVRLARYIPQSLLLDRVSAVVTHGGFNTVLAALSFGVPVCCVPLSTDHPVNARRCVDLGAGTSVTTWAPPDGWPLARPEDVTASAIRDAVRPLLHAPEHREHAGRLREEIAALPGVEHAVALIEGLAD